MSAPQWARKLLERLAPPGRADEVIGDLEETHDDSVHRRGRAVATLTTAIETMDMAVALLWERADRRAATASQAGRPDSGSSVPMASVLDFELRRATRLLLRQKQFSVLTVSVLGFGVGAATIAFSFVHGLLLRPLGYPASDQLVEVNRRDAGTGAIQVWFSFPDFRDVRSRSKSFASLAAFQYGLFNVAGRPYPIALLGAHVTSDLFPMLGVQPELGRVFVKGEDSPGRNGVVILSDRIWRSRFGADPTLIGRVVNVESTPVVVVGVMPSTFRFPATLPASVALPSRDPDLWMPVGAANDREARGDQAYWVLGRLRPGISVEQARVDVAAITTQLEKDYPAEESKLSPTVVSLRSQIVNEVKDRLLIVFGAVLLVLLIACSNVASLFIARAVHRRRELGLRVALGATRARLVRELFVDSSLVALAGGTLGVGISAWGIYALRSRVPNTIPRLDEVTLDARVLGFALVLTLVTAVLFGIAPALQATGSLDYSSLSLRAGNASAAGTGRTRAVFVAGEVAMSLVLLIGAGLLLQTLVRLQSVSLGFDPKNVVTMFVQLSDRKFPTLASRDEFVRRTLERLQTIPGMASVGAVNTIPMAAPPWRLGVAVEGKAYRSPADLPMLEYRIVAGDYLNAMHIPLLAGRQFANSDDSSSPPVAIINQAMAAEYFPGGAALGKRVRVFNGDSALKTIVGVVADARYEDFDKPAGPEVIIPYSQAPDRPSLSLVLRSSAPVDGILRGVRNEIASVDPTQPVFALRTMEDVLTGTMTQREFTASLITLFALATVCLAGLGLYSVMSMWTTDRTHEIGIRIALGAGRKDVFKMIISEGARLSVVGVGIGIGIALLATRLLSGLLYGVNAADLSTFVVCAVLSIGFCLVATYIPASRAARVDPLTALRHE